MKRLKESLGDNIRRRREQLDLTQADLAEHAGISRQVIGRIEGGQSWPDFSTLEAIAGALRVDAVVLFNFSNAYVPNVLEKIEELRDSMKLLLDDRFGQNSSERSRLVKLVLALPERVLPEVIAFVESVLGSTDDLKVPTPTTRR